ncbi:ribonuclease H-like domain-containing protein [Solibacillus silvestris]|uniref:ribonuclease H-like domain-containing protein n=1 Tax=Solibacillus silvestris TaxID=76853 RepID=UPI003F7F15AE
MSYENKLLQMKKMLGKKTEHKQEKPKFIKPEPPLYSEQWQQAGLKRIENEFGMLFKREVHYPFDYQHGNHKLGELFHALKRWKSQADDHPFAISEQETIMFFDTETTGLKGAGTHIFLLGFLQADEEGFLLTQYVLADPSNEAAFLFESKLWQREATIVSYNGKSFDWPQLQVRWTLNKQHLPPLKTQRQIDLLHSTKRLWKDDLSRMKLIQVEQEKLGFYRKGDIPGHLAPIIYFDAVKSGSAETLIKVLVHNEWDLLSLITLYIHSTNLLFDAIAMESATTYTNIGKWFGDLKKRKTSTEILQAVTKHFNTNEAGYAHFYLAYELKRTGETDLAIESFRSAIPAISARKQLQAYEQLAMLYEHQVKDYELAFMYSEKGRDLLDKISFQKEIQLQNQQKNWQKRLVRLDNKRNKNNGDKP